MNWLRWSDGETHLDWVISQMRGRWFKVTRKGTFCGLAYLPEDASSMVCGLDAGMILRGAPASPDYRVTPFTPDPEQRWVTHWFRALKGGRWFFVMSEDRKAGLVYADGELPRDFWQLLEKAAAVPA